MARLLEWVRAGFCTALGLVLIGVAAVSPPAFDPEGPVTDADDPGRSAG